MTVTRRLVLIRVIVLLTAVLGLNYVVWRWLYSVNWDYWWIAVPLVMAETYSLVDSLLFGLGMWKLNERGEPPPAPEGLTVDVFIATYNEPIELVMETALAAKAIRYPHKTWVLDDGNRDLPATNLTLFAAGGQMSVTGEPDREPLVNGGTQPLMQAGLHGFSATVTAIYGARAHGTGTHVDISIQEVQAASLEGLRSALQEAVRARFRGRPRPISTSLRFVKEEVWSVSTAEA